MASPMHGLTGVHSELRILEASNLPPSDCSTHQLICWYGRKIRPPVRVVVQKATRLEVASLSTFMMSANGSRTRLKGELYLGSIS